MREGERIISHESANGKMGSPAKVPLSRDDMRVGFKRQVHISARSHYLLSTLRLGSDRLSGMTGISAAIFASLSTFLHITRSRCFISLSPSPPCKACVSASPPRYDTFPSLSTLHYLDPLASPRSLISLLLIARLSSLDLPYASHGRSLHNHSRLPLIISLGHLPLQLQRQPF